MYIPSRVRSNYSFLDGASDPSELLATCRAFGIRAMALCDTHGVHGIIKAALAAKAHRVHLISGATFELCDALSITLLVMNDVGWSNLCRLISESAPEAASKPLPSWAQLRAWSEGLIALWEPIGRIGEHTIAHVDRLAEVFLGRHYAAIGRHARAGDDIRERAARFLAARITSPVIASPHIHYHSQERRMLHDVMRCVRARVSIERAGTRLLPNDTFHLPSPDEMRHRWRDDLDALARTRELAARCDFDPLSLALPQPVVEVTEEDLIETLRARVWRGARRRFGDAVPDKVRDQILHELGVIEALGYEGYFLAMEEIVAFCRGEGILCQGRGSAANSVVCYCLGVTAVDPIEAGLLFERFLSPHRREPPDIDLDVMHQRREEVIQHIYARHGEEHAAMLCNIVRFRRKLALREVGKVLGFSEAVLGRLVKTSRRGAPIDDAMLATVGLDPAARRVHLLLRLASQLEGAPRHLSIHPGGFLISQAPIREFIPVGRASMEGRTIIQWDKYDVDALSLFKVDILGLGALSMVDHALKMLSEREGRAIGLADLPGEDARTYAMLSRGDAIGVFQLESRAQAAMLPRLKPRCFYDLVIEISLVRPGPIQGGMVKPFLARRQGKEAVVYPHPSLEPILGKTLGVPIFQEQVMRVAMVAAGYSAGEADQLRRDLGAWDVEGALTAHRERLTSGMRARGISGDFAARICKQLEGFASYGFPESHAASFALIAYATAYLRCHHPTIFTCALLRAQPMGFYPTHTILEDAKRRGVEVLPIDVTQSALDHEIVGLTTRRGGAIRLGLRLVKGAVEEDLERLVRARAQAPFQSIEEMIVRARLGRRTALALARADALGSFGMERRAASWAARGGLARRDDRLRLTASPREPAPQPAQLELFEHIARDWEASGTSSRGHPLAPWRDRLMGEDAVRVSAAHKLGAGSVILCAGLVIRRQRPQSAGGVLFLTLEDESGLIDVIVEQDVQRAHDALIKTENVLLVWGEVRREGARVWIQATSIIRFPWAREVPSTRSVDYR